MSTRYIEGKRQEKRKELVRKSTFFDDKIVSVMKREKYITSVKQSPVRRKQTRIIKYSCRETFDGAPEISHGREDDTSSPRRSACSAWAKYSGSYSSSESEHSDSSSEEEVTTRSGTLRNRRYSNCKDVSEGATTTPSSQMNRATATLSAPQHKFATTWMNYSAYSSSSEGSDTEDMSHDSDSIDKENVPQSSPHDVSPRRKQINLKYYDTICRESDKWRGSAMNTHENLGRNVSNPPAACGTCPRQAVTTATPLQVTSSTPIDRDPIYPSSSCSTHRNKQYRNTARTETSPSTQGQVPPGSVGKLLTDLARNKEIIEMLKSQLLSKGVEPITEVISYQQAQEKLKTSLELVMGGDERAEGEFNKWDEYVRNHPEYKAQAERARAQWISRNHLLNRTCYNLIRELVPPDIAQSSLSRLANDLPVPIAKRIWARKALWLTRISSEKISRLHVADLQTKYSVQGLDEVELRAVWYAMPERFENDPTKAKVTWKEALLASICEKKGIEREGIECVEDAGVSEEAVKECEMYAFNIQRNAVYKDILKVGENGSRWRGPYDHLSAFVDDVGGASHASTQPIRPVVNKLTPSRRKKLGFAIKKGITPIKKRDNASPTGGLCSIPEAPDETIAQGCSGTDTTSIGDSVNSTVLVSSPKKTRRTGPLVGGNVRSVMEEILMKGLLKNKMA